MASTIQPVVTAVNAGGGQPGEMQVAPHPEELAGDAIIWERRAYGSTLESRRAALPPASGQGVGKFLIGRGRESDLPGGIGE